MNRILTFRRRKTNGTMFGRGEMTGNFLSETQENCGTKESSNGCCNTVVPVSLMVNVKVLMSCNKRSKAQIQAFFSEKYRKSPQ